MGCQFPFSASPCTVVISCPSACTARTVQDLTDSPSISTVQAPQLVVSQPECTPPIPRFSLRWWMSRSRGSTSATCHIPSTVISILRKGPPFLAGAREGRLSPHRLPHRRISPGSPIPPSEGSHPAPQQALLLLLFSL